MALKNSGTKSPRFRVERMGLQFVILDTETCSYTECPPDTTRSQAESERARVELENALAEHGLLKAPKRQP